MARTSHNFLKHVTLRFKVDGALVFPTLGLLPKQAYVELDNAAHVHFYDGRPGNPAVWAVERFGRWTKSELSQHHAIGEMDTAGLLLVVEGLMALAEARPELFSPHLRKRIAKVAVELRKRSAAP